MRRVAAAGPLGVEVVALHVHHGLSRARRRLARALPAPVPALGAARPGDRVRRDAGSTIGPARGREHRGLGAAASATARSREMALERGADLVLLGHHRRDQAETLLLQALRGGGVAGAVGDAARGSGARA